MNAEKTRIPYYSTYETGVDEDGAFIRMFIYDYEHHLNDSFLIKDFLDELGTKFLYHELPFLLETKEYDDMVGDGLYYGDACLATLTFRRNSMNIIDFLSVKRSCKKFIKRW